MQIPSNFYGKVCRLCPCSRLCVKRVDVNVMHWNVALMKIIACFARTGACGCYHGACSTLQNVAVCRHVPKATTRTETKATVCTTQPQAPLQRRQCTMDI